MTSDVPAFDIVEPGDGVLTARPGDLPLARSFVVAAREHDGAEPVRHRMLDLIDCHPDALVRTCRPGHLTGSALVVDSTASRVLLLWHNKAQRWLQPGGHADGDGNLAHVAWREATEETGISDLRILVPAIDLDIHLFDPPNEDAHDHHDVRFVVLAPPDAEPVGNHESAALVWVAVEELSDYHPDPGLERLAARGIEVARSLIGRSGDLDAQ